jgi:TPR repeat protein
MHRREEDDPEALFNLAVRYQNGDGVEESAKKAVELFQQLADQFKATASNAQWKDFAKLHLDHDGDVKKSAGTAVEMLQQLANQGHIRALCVLSHLYRKGLGVEPDLEMCCRLQDRASFLEWRYTETLLGLCRLYLEGGIGVEKDPVKATALIRQAQGINYFTFLPPEWAPEWLRRECLGYRRS